MMSAHHTWLRRWSWKQDFAIRMSVVMLVSSFTMSVASAGQPSAAEITAPLQKSYQELGAAIAGNDKGVGADPKLGAATGSPPATGVFVAFPLPPDSDLERAAAQELVGAGAQPKPTREALQARVDAFAKAFPAAECDLATAVAALELGVEAAFRFIRDRIAFEAYPGFLRGPQVTYATRAGNAFDRSLLLAALLDRQGVRTRFARGRLSPADTEKLFERVFQAPPPSRTNAENLTALRSRPDSLFARLTARAQRDYARIRGALGSSLPSAVDPSRQRVLEEIRDHLWVQAEVDGKWVDLDPSFPDDAVGTAHCPVDATADVPPVEAFQTVTLRVLAERLDGEKLREQTVLEITRPAAMLLDQEIFLIHLPASVGGLVGAIAGAVERDVRRPALMIAGELMVGETVEFSEGDVPGRGAPPRSGLRGAFGSGGPLAATRPALVAEWLEFELATPGRARETTRRALVDRAGAAWRRAASHDASALRPLARDEQGPLSPRTVHNVWITAGRHDLAVLADVGRRLAASLGTASAESSPTRSRNAELRELLWPFGFQNAVHLFLSDELIVGSLNDVAGVRFYADSPRIAVVSVGTPPRSDAMQTTVTIDLRRDRLRGLARDEVATRAVVQRKLWFAALQGALEHEALSPHLDPAGGAAIDSTSARVGAGAVLLGPEDVSKVAERLENPDAAALAEVALRAGHRLVLAAEPAPDGLAAWWEVAPDGTTRAFLGPDLGGGQISVPLGVPRRNIPKPDWFYRPDIFSLPPGVIPRDPLPGPVPWKTDPWGFQPPTSPGIMHQDSTRIIRRSDPNAETKIRPRPDAERRSAKGSGGGNEYTMIIAEEAVPNPIAVLESYVDKFLVGSSEVAVRVASVLMEVLSLY